MAYVARVQSEPPGVGPNSAEVDARSAQFGRCRRELARVGQASAGIPRSSTARTALVTKADRATESTGIVPVEYPKRNQQRPRTTDPRTAPAPDAAAAAARPQTCAGRPAAAAAAAPARASFEGQVCEGVRPGGRADPGLEPASPIPPWVDARAPLGRRFIPPKIAFDANLSDVGRRMRKAHPRSLRASRGRPSVYRKRMMPRLP